MKSLVILLMFVGLFMVAHGVYQEKLKAVEQNVRVEYRFIPRTFYEEQMASNDVMGTLGNMFDSSSSPWLNQGGAGA